MGVSTSPEGRRRTSLFSNLGAFFARHRRLVLATSTLCCLVTVWLAALAVTIYRYSGLREPRRADAAVVLGAAVWGLRPSPVLRERIDHAVWLYRHGYVGKVVFTGGSDSGPALSEAAVSRRYALVAGVRRDDILVEGRSQITEENLRNVKPILTAAGLNSVLLVSDPLHMRRAITMAKDLGIDASPAPTPTTRIRSASAKAKFLARETFFYGLYLVKRPFD